MKKTCIKKFHYFLFLKCDITVSYRQKEQFDKHNILSKITCNIIQKIENL